MEIINISFHSPVLLRHSDGVCEKILEPLQVNVTISLIWYIPFIGSTEMVKFGSEMKGPSENINKNNVSYFQPI